MSQLLHGFDANQIDPYQELSAIPAGEYIAAIVESEEKPTKAGTGQYLELKFQVLDGDFKGRMVWDRLNLANPNVQAVNIARARLSSICRAVGVPQPRVSADLHNKPLVIKVSVESIPDSDRQSNRIEDYKPTGAVANNGQPPIQAPKAAGAPPTQPPWKR